MLQQQQKQQGQQLSPSGSSGGSGEESALTRRYRVNVLVDHSESKGAPVVYEDNPTYSNLIERSSRMTGDGEKLSVHMQRVSDLVRESDYWAGQNGNGTVGASDVQKAIDAWIYRSDRLRERTQEQIQRGFLFVDTEGSKAGQVNGLSVLQLGDFIFGRPSRITARIRMGKGEVVDIELEVEMGGPIHSKGVLILSGFLGERYATDRPLSLSASLVFEQSYTGIEGDSASSAELYALLSAIAKVPVKQSLAVTGSVDQHGRIQPIGGVNEKIEGFFDTCKGKGLNGEQGVLIPASNVKEVGHGGTYGEDQPGGHSVQSERTLARRIVVCVHK